MPNCPKCGGTMSVNADKRPGTKQPDYQCNQDNGECMTESGYPTGAWKPKQKAASQATKVDPSVWEAKDRLSAAQTALNASANVFQGTKDAKAVIETAKQFYEFLRVVKAGRATKPEPQQPDDEEINVEDIPF